jgi:multidrug efflux pump subunit AcrB
VASTLEAELKRVPGTREVQTIGGPGMAVHGVAGPGRMRERGVDLQRLQQTLAAANMGLPSARCSTRPCGSRGMLTVETGNLRSADEVADWWWASARGARSTCARWPGRSRCAQATAMSGSRPGRRLPQRRASGASAPAPVQPAYPAVTLTVTKKPGQNAVDVARAARERLDELRNTVMPADVETTITRDYGETAAEKANKLIQKLAFATGSVILLVGLALGRREAVIVGAAVILTLTATLFASWAWGFTLNRVSLFALIFSIGILVDDAIVVVENIHRHQQLTPASRCARSSPWRWTKSVAPPSWPR